MKEAQARKSLIFHRPPALSLFSGMRGLAVASSLNQADPLTSAIKKVAVSLLAAEEPPHALAPSLRFHLALGSDRVTPTGSQRAGPRCQAVNHSRH